MRRPIGILILAGLAFLAAQGTGLRLFFHLSYLLVGLLLVSLAWAWLNLRGLEVEREQLTNRAHVGEIARERITLRNRWRLPKLWVELEDASDLPEHGAGFVAYLGPRQRSRWIARTRCSHRGRFTLGPARLVSGDPFGIWRLSRPDQTTSEILVYPQLVDLPTFRLPSAELPGGQDTRARAFNVTPNVSSIRDYAPGDSFNRIHWRSTARLGRMMVKEFELDPSADVYLVLDLEERSVVTAPPLHVPRERERFWWQRRSDDVPLSPPSDESTEELAVAAAASLAQNLLRANRVVGLIAWGDHREVISAERESRQLFKILEALAVVRAHGQHSLAEVLLAEASRFSRNSTLVIITSSLDERWVAALQQILYRGLRAVVIFVDPQSFGGWQAPEPTIASVLALGVPLYRLQRGTGLAEALQTPQTGIRAA